MKIAIIMKKIELLKLCGEICDAKSAPPHAPMNAGITIASSNFESVLIDFRYLIAAVEVPKKAAVLDVATTETGFRSGNESNIAGVWIRPPPPAIASTNPAENIARNSRATLRAERS